MTETAPTQTPLTQAAIAEAYDRPLPLLEPFRFPFQAGPAATPGERRVDLMAQAIAIAFGLHGSCRRRACRDGCRAAGKGCGAMFPPETLRIMEAMHYFGLACVVAEPRAAEPAQPARPKRRPVRRSPAWSAPR